MKNHFSKAEEQALATMKANDQGIVRALLNGQTQQEVSFTTGIPQSVVSYTHKRFQAKVRVALGGGLSLRNQARLKKRGIAALPDD